MPQEDQYHVPERMAAPGGWRWRPLDAEIGFEDDLVLDLADDTEVTPSDEAAFAHVFNRSVDEVVADAAPEIGELAGRAHELRAEVDLAAVALAGRGSARAAVRWCSPTRVAAPRRARARSRRRGRAKSRAAPDPPEPPRFNSCAPGDLAPHLLRELLSLGYTDLRVEADGRWRRLTAGRAGDVRVEISPDEMSRLVQAFAGRPCRTRRAGVRIQASTVDGTIRELKRLVASRAPPQKHDAPAGGNRRGAAFMTPTTTEKDDDRRST